MRLIFILMLAVSSLLSCKQPVYDNAERDAELLSLGDSITRIAFMELSAELTAAMSEKGVPHALQHCNTHALNITKEVSFRYKAAISRVSDRYRNQANAANEMETTLMKEYRQQILAGNKPVHQLIHTSDGKTIYYKPILLQPQCMVCHGSKEQIGAENMLIIKNLYPGDLATGFKEGDLRGLWKVEF
jgi:hypothetical protein